MATGPYSRTVSKPYNQYSRSYFASYWWMRNGPGKKTPHPFRLRRCYSGGNWQNVEGDAPNTTVGYYSYEGWLPVSLGGSSLYFAVRDKCREKFVDATRSGVSSQLGAAMGEWRQSASMTGNRLGQLTEAARALRRGRPFEFFEALGQLHKAPRNTPKKSKPEKAGDLWLEYWFGWVPLVSDIYSSVKILEGSVQVPVKVKVRHSSLNSLYDTSSNHGTGNNQWRYREKFRYKTRCQMGVKLRVTNPNLYRASQLGLVNPASVAWELIPFSFVIDWFYPVGAFLSSWTDTLGLTFEDAYTTSSSHYTEGNTLMESNFPDSIWRHQADWTSKAFYVNRELGIPSYSLQSREFRGISLTRGATACSLLLQQLYLMRQRR